MDSLSNETCMAISTVLLYMLMNKKLNVKNATSFIRETVKLVDSRKKETKNLSVEERKQLTVQFVENIAKGPDGILGTKDDLVPQTTIEQLKTFLMDKTVIEDIIDLCITKDKTSYIYILRLFTCGYKTCGF